MSNSKEPTWLSKPALLAIHGRLLADYGGASGLRDEGLMESAMASPLNHFQYGETDIYLLASAYAFALTSNHPFIDGNKRTAFTAAGVFMEMNRHQLKATESDAVNAVLALSKGELDSEEFGKWLRISSIQLPRNSR